MRTATILLSGLLMSSLTLACDSKGDDKPAADAKEGEKEADGADAKAEEGGEAKAEEGGAKAGGDLALPKTGLKAPAIADASVSEMMGMDMVKAPGLVATVEGGDDKPKTGEDAQKDADMYTPENAKVETLPDGYVFTFTNKGGMGENFWVQSRREIGGKAFWCSTTASSKEQQDNAVAFCKSLKQ